MDTRNKKFKLDFMPIGQDIKQAREARNVTREQLSEVIDYAPRHIQAIENEGQTPSVDLLFQLAEMGGADENLDQTEVEESACTVIKNVKKPWSCISSTGTERQR